jgi:hypothetical protein
MPLPPTDFEGWTRFGVHSFAKRYYEALVEVAAGWLLSGRLGISPRPTSRGAAWEAARDLVGGFAAAQLEGEGMRATVVSGYRDARGAPFRAYVRRSLYYHCRRHLEGPRGTPHDDGPDPRAAVPLDEEPAAAAADPLEPLRVCTRAILNHCRRDFDCLVADAVHDGERREALRRCLALWWPEDPGAAPLGRDAIAARLGLGAGTVRGLLKEITGLLVHAVKRSVEREGEALLREAGVGALEESLEAWFSILCLEWRAVEAQEGERG